MATSYIVWNVIDRKIEAGPFPTSPIATAALSRVQKNNQGAQGGIKKTVSYTIETVTT